MPQCSFAQVWIIAEKKVEVKIQRKIFVDSNVEEFLYLFDVMKTVYNKGITDEPFCIVLLKVIGTLKIYQFPFSSNQGELEHWRF